MWFHIEHRIQKFKIDSDGMELLNWQPHLCSQEGHRTIWNFLVEDILRHLICPVEDREVIQDNQHVFTTGKSCLTKSMAFFGGATASVDKGRVTNVSYLDFIKAFISVLYNIFISRLERYRFDGCTVQWMRNSLWNHIQTVMVNHSESKWRSKMKCISQESVLGPIFLNTIINNLDCGIKCTLSKFPDYTKLQSTCVRDGMPCRVILTETVLIQDEVQVKLMRFNRSKWKVLQQSHSNPTINRSWKMNG